jgi:very-short-patch-repair endonuclease
MRKISHGDFMEYKSIRPPNKIVGYANKMRKNPTRYEQMVKFALDQIATNDTNIGKFLSIIKNQFCFYDRSKNRWYITDFYIPEMRLIIEVDGRQHLTNSKQVRRDIERTRFLKFIGLSVERILNSAVVSNDFNNNLQQILHKHIRKQLKEYYVLNTSWKNEKRLAKKIRKFHKKVKKWNTRRNVCLI